MFDDAVISHQKTQSYNGPRVQTGILSKNARKRPTDKKLESAARGMSRVGKGKTFNSAESLPLTKRTFEAFPSPKMKAPLQKRDKPKDRNLKNKPDVGRNKQEREDAVSAGRTAKRNIKVTLNRGKTDAKREEAHQKKIERVRAEKTIEQLTPIPTQTMRQT